VESLPQPAIGPHAAAIRRWLPHPRQQLHVQHLGTPTTTVASGFGDLGFRYLYVGASDVEWDNSFGLGLLYMHGRHYSLVTARDPRRSTQAAASRRVGYRTPGR